MNSTKDVTLTRELSSVWMATCHWDHVADRLQSEMHLGSPSTEVPARYVAGGGAVAAGKVVGDAVLASALARCQEAAALPQRDRSRGTRSIQGGCRWIVRSIIEGRSRHAFGCCPRCGADAGCGGLLSPPGRRTGPCAVPGSKVSARKVAGGSPYNLGNVVSSNSHVEA